MIAIIMMIDDRSMIVFGAGVSWDLFFGAYHFCSIKTVDLTRLLLLEGMEGHMDLDLICWIKSGKFIKCLG